jgi:hypothetical protein
MICKEKRSSIMSKETKGLRPSERDPEKNKHKKNTGLDTGRTTQKQDINGLGNFKRKNSRLDSSTDSPASIEKFDSHADSYVDSHAEIKFLTEKLDQPMRSAFRRLDYNRIETIKSTFQSSKNELLRIQIQTQISIKLSPRMGKSFLATIDAYERLLDETERSGVALELSEWQERLQSVISRSILPKEDFEWASPDEIDDMIKTMRESKLLGEDFGRSELAKLDRARHHRVRDTFGWLMNWKKVVLGAGLAATNLALGGVAILAYNPAFGQVDLPSTLAIAGSVYLGLSDAKNSLHQVNAGIEGEEDKLE